MSTYTAARRIRRLPAFVAAPVALALVSTACGPTSSGSGDNSTLTMLAIQDSASLDPFRRPYIAVTDEPRLSALYDPMLYIDPKTGTVTPHLAESLATADGGRTWLLKLRPDVKFSDGSVFDAAAVRLNWETHTKPETKSVHVAYASGLTLRVVDPLTLEIVPRAPNPNFDRTVATHLTYIEAPSAIARGVDAAGTQPVGAGPFMLKSWIRGNEQVFVRNPHYWQKDKGLPKLSQLTIKTSADGNQSYNTVRSGGADLFMTAVPEILTQAEGDLQTFHQKDLGGQMFLFNTTRAPFDDPRARRAIALALDPADIPATLHNGYLPSNSFFNPASPFFDPSAAQPRQNKEEAQRLFDELAAEGQPVAFTHLIPKNSDSQKVAEYMQSRLRTFRNTSMEIESLEIGAYIVKYAINKDFQSLLFQQWLVDPEPEMFDMFHSQSPMNYSGWRNAEADAALLAGRTNSDPAARKKAYADLQRIMADELPVWVYSQSIAGPVAGKSLTGLEQYNTGCIFMDRIDVK
ncbi:ABC transporter substrate-binding protein [Yinghuangia sp. YIM S09857]|uniref:ABC transporter substrate-binding protein n=1 Tax=Yinghuangia sp. YIM S09857 TaxID=3436929 RepID=UPI003F53A6DF